jgi:hypothetical protein
VIEEVIQFRNEVIDLLNENKNLKNDLKGLIYANLISSNLKESKK